MTYAPAEASDEVRVAFAIGRPVGNAVTRNRLRRRLRHRLRECSSDDLPAGAGRIGVQGVGA